MKQAEQARLFLRKAAEDESLLDAMLILTRKNEPFDVLALLTGMVARNPRNIMKTVTLLCLSFFLARKAVGATGEQFRTDINPALQYYQAFVKN